MLTNKHASMFNATSGRCINVALDLGVFGARSFSLGIEKLDVALLNIISGKPDVIQLNPGGFKIFEKLSVMQPVSIALRLDATNAYEPNSLERAWDIVNENTLGDAEDPRIACVVLNLLNIDGDSSLQEQCIANIQLIGALCRQREILLMVEPLVMTAMSGGNPTSIYDIDKIATLVRQAVELGADFIKVDPTDPLERFNEIVEIASGIPVFVRGGGKVTPRELLERTKIVIESGAQGVVYGRNIVQHPTPAKYVQAIAAVVHENASVDDALLRLAK